MKLVPSIFFEASLNNINLNIFNPSLLEKGKQILMKDNLIDEERAKQEEAAQESLDQKLERLGKIDQSCYISII